MRKIKTFTVTQQVSETVDITCNCCGKTCKDSAGLNYEGLLGAQLCGGYASKLGDSIRYEFDVCETCLLAWFAGFKHDPCVPDQ